MQRRTRFTLVALMSASLALLPATLASADVQDGDQLFVVTTGNESIADAIAAHAANDPEYREAAIDLTETWLTRLSQGLPVDGLVVSPVSTSSALSQNDIVSELHSNLVSGDLPQTELFSPGAGTPSARSAQDASVLAVNGDNPNSFDVRGSAAISYWTGMQLINAGAFCGAPGCNETDRFTSNVTIDPGAVTSRVSATNLYSPNGGNFENKHFELWAINSGSYVGNSDTGNLPNSSEDFVSSTRALNNSVLTTAVTQWVYVAPYGGYVADGAKTTDAYCAAPGDNSCNY